MIGLGTIINAIGALIGGFLGLFAGKILKEPLQDILIRASGIAYIFIGAAGALQRIFIIQGSGLTTSGTIMMILSLCIGAMIGTVINIEFRMKQFGTWVKAKSGNSRDHQFIEGFVTTTLMICIGAMAIIGPINDALYGDYSILITKAFLDCILVFIYTSKLGKGCIFAVIPLLLVQGGITALARVIAPIMTPLAISNLSLIGSILIFCIGINLAFDKKLKVANMLPALIIAILCAFLPIKNI